MNESNPASPTETAQAELIIENLPGVAAYPPDWRTSGGIQFFYREDSVLVRDWSVPLVTDIAERRVGGPRLTPRSLPGSLTRLTWDRRDDLDSPLTLIARLEDEDGDGEPVRRGVLAPDHLLYVCVHACAAVEQEPVPADAEPVPRPQYGQDTHHPGSRNGKGVEVLVVDSGLVADATQEHPWLAGVTGEQENPYAPDGTLRQDAGHGTFTAGCVRVTAPEAGVHVIDGTVAIAGTGQAGTGAIGAAFESDLADLIRSALVGGGTPGRPAAVPDVLLVNFAGTTYRDVPPVALSALYDDLLQHLKELIVVAPAGNEGDTRKNWPAAYGWAVSVGALAKNWRDLASWSNRGRNVDVYSPGEDLVNAYARGSYTYRWQGPRQGSSVTFDGMARWSGTSFSTPLVAGLIASRVSTTGQSSRRAWHSLQDLSEGQAVAGVGPVLYPGQGTGGR